METTGGRVFGREMILAEGVCSLTIRTSICIQYLYGRRCVRVRCLGRDIVLVTSVFPSLSLHDFQTPANRLAEHTKEAFALQGAI